MGKQVVEGPGLFPAAVNINGTDEAHTIELIRRDGIVLTERVTEADTDNIVRVRDQHLPYSGLIFNAGLRGKDDIAGAGQQTAEDLIVVVFPQNDGTLRVEPHKAADIKPGKIHIIAAKADI